MRKTARLITMTLAVIVLLALSIPRSARADLTFDLSTGNTGLSGFAGPYAHVDISLSGQTATVTFTSLTNGGNIYLMGDGGSVDLNVHAASFTVGTITGTNAGTGFAPGPLSQDTAGTVDGFGTFNLKITSFDGFTHSSDKISFTVTNTSLTSWLSVNDVLSLNSNGADAAAHIFVTSSPANAANGAIVTGFASNFVPEAGSMGLLGLGLLALLGLGRLERRERAVSL